MKPSSATANLLPRRPKAWNDGASLSAVALCATYTADGRAPVITVDPGNTPTFSPTDRAAASGYDRIVITPGSGALLRDANSVDKEAAATHLIWNGKRYGIPDAASRQALGYGDTGSIAAVQSQILAMIPPGLPDGVVLNQQSVLAAR